MVFVKKCQACVMLEQFYILLSHILYLVWSMARHKQLGRSIFLRGERRSICPLNFAEVYFIKKIKHYRLKIKKLQALRD